MRKAQVKEYYERRKKMNVKNYEAARSNCIIAKSIVKDKVLSTEVKIICLSNCLETIEQLLEHPMRKGEYK